MFIVNVFVSNKHVKRLLEIMKFNTNLNPEKDLFLEFKEFLQLIFIFVFLIKNAMNSFKIDYYINRKKKLICLPVSSIFVLYIKP